MKRVAIKAICEQFTLKAPKPKKPSTIALKWWVVETTPNLVAALCFRPAAAELALKQCAEAGGKIELPCTNDLAILSMECDDDSHEVAGVVLKTLSMDCSGGAICITLNVEHQDRRADIDFYYDGRGKMTELVIAPAQGTLPGAKEDAAQVAPRA